MIYFGCLYFQTIIMIYHQHFINNHEKQNLDLIEKSFLLVINNFSFLNYILLRLNSSDNLNFVKIHLNYKLIAKWTTGLSRLLTGFMSYKHVVVFMEIDIT